MGEHLAPDGGGGGGGSERGGLRSSPLLLVGFRPFLAWHPEVSMRMEVMVLFSGTL